MNVGEVVSAELAVIVDVDTINRECVDEDWVVIDPFELDGLLLSLFDDFHGVSLIKGSVGESFQLNDDFSTISGYHKDIIFN